MKKIIPPLFWTLIGLALLALVAVLTARAVLQRHPAEVSARLTAELAKHIPDAQAEFSSAELRFSLRGFLHAHVRDLLLRRGAASVSVPAAEIWLQGGGLVARFHSPTIQFAPAKRGGVFPAIALGGLKIAAAENAVLSAPVPGWGGVTLRGVNLTVAQRENGDVFLRMQSEESGKKLSLEVNARQNFTFSARAFARGFPPPQNFPVQWDADAESDIWLETDLKKNEWKIAADAKGQSAEWRGVGAAQNISARAIFSRNENGKTLAFNATAQNAALNEIGEVANISISADLAEAGETRTAIIAADGAGTALNDIGVVGLLTATIFASQTPAGYSATVFAGGEDLKLARLTHSIFAETDARKYLSHAEWGKFFVNAEVSGEAGKAGEFGGSGEARESEGGEGFGGGDIVSAKLFAEGERLSGIFGDAVSLQLRANGRAEADGALTLQAALAAQDIYSPFAGSALTANAVASLKRTAGQTLRVAFLADLNEAESLRMPLEAPPLRALRAYGEWESFTPPNNDDFAPPNGDDFAPPNGDDNDNGDGDDKNEWTLHLPWMQIIPGVAEPDDDIETPSVSSFPIRVGAREIASPSPVPSETESESGAALPQPQPAIIRASLSASGADDEMQTWKLAARATDLQAGDIWRYIPAAPKTANLREWFRKSLPQGVVSRAEFRGGRDIPAELTGVFEDGRLVIGPGWPDAQNLSGAFSFLNESVNIHGEGTFDGLPIQDVVASIPAVYAETATLHLQILPAPQSLPRYLQTALNLPQGDDYRETVESFELPGRGALSIAAQIPLTAETPNTFNAMLQVDNGRFSHRTNAALPAFESARGEVVITNEGADATFTGRMQNAPATLQFNSAGDFELQGRLSAARAMTIAALNFPARGTLDFSLARRNGTTVFASELRGIELLLPAPFNKRPESSAPVVARLNGAQTSVSASINGNKVDAVLLGLTRGAIGLNAKAGKIPESGFRAEGGASGADLDGWLALAFADGKPDAGAGGAARLTLRNAKALGRTVSVLTLMVDALSGAPLSATIAAPDFRGGVSVDFESARGRVELAYVNLPGDSDDDSDSVSVSAPDAEESRGDFFLPPRDFVLTATIADLRRDGERLGGGGAVIVGTADSWSLSDGVLALGENRLEARARYAAGGAFPRTEVSLHLAAGDLAGLMRGLGLDGVVERGKLTVSGELSWPFSPADLGFAGMGGRLRLDASEIAYETRGGAGVSGVVSFLSVFSPLSLLTLGFLKAGQRESTLDRVECDIVIEDGVAMFPGVLLQNEDVVINMTGETDLANRRHNLRGEVKPGDRILKAVGPALWATGQIPAFVVIEVVRRVFEKPLSNLGAYEYTIRGDWDAPEYKEIGSGEAEGEE